MTSLYRYWLKEFFKFFGIIQSLILVLFFVIDYLSRLDKFLNTELSFTGGFFYVMLKLPFMFVQLTPASVLIAAIAIFAVMNRNNELLAVKSSGISGYMLMKPAVFTGASLTFLMFFLGETVVPVSMSRANYIKYNIMKKNDNRYLAREDIWIKSEISALDTNLTHINFYDPANRSIAGITITSLNKKFQIQSRIDAKNGHYISGRWVLEKVIEQIHEKGTLDYDVKIEDTKSVDLGFTPDDLKEIAKKSDEMSFFELRKYIKKTEEEGYDATTYKVDLHAKIAFPFICIIMVLTGAANGMKSFAKYNIPAAIAVGVIIAFMYWFTYGFALSLGYGSVFPPIISAWITNIFFLGFGILYLINTE